MGPLCTPPSDDKTAFSRRTPIGLLVFIFYFSSVDAFRAGTLYADGLPSGCSALFNMTWLVCVFFSSFTL